MTRKNLISEISAFFKTYVNVSLKICVQTYVILSFIWVANIMNFLAFIALPVSLALLKTVYKMDRNPTFY